MTDMIQETKANGQEKIVSFHLGEQVFCLDIMTVREIRGWQQTTPLPHSPDYVLGVINLRGAVIPVIDMAVRLGLPATVPSERSAIIVTDEGDRFFGLLVENVSDLISFNPADMQKIPDVLPQEIRTLAKGIIPVNEQMICFLNLGPLFEGTENLDLAA